MSARSITIPVWLAQLVAATLLSGSLALQIWLVKSVSELKAHVAALDARIELRLAAN